MLMDGRGQFLIARNNLLVIGLDHLLIGPISGMDGELSQDDEATASFRPLFIISNVPIIDKAIFGKIGSMCRKADPIRNFYFPKPKRRKENWIGMTHL
jgi:hypothetical protein